MLETNELNQRELFALNLRDYLSVHGISQLELSKKTGISTSAISAYVVGARYPRVEQMQAIANALNVSVSALTDSAEDKAADHAILGYPTVNSIVEYCLAMPEEKRRLVLSYAQFLCSQVKDNT